MVNKVEHTDYKDDKVIIERTMSDTASFDRAVEIISVKWLHSVLLKVIDPPLYRVCDTSGEAQCLYSIPLIIRMQLEQSQQDKLVLLLSRFVNARFSTAYRIVIRLLTKPFAAI